MEKQPAFNFLDLLQRDRIETKLNNQIDLSKFEIGEEFNFSDLNPDESYFFEKQFNQFLELVVEEQLMNAGRLLSLNPSRRESLGRFLAELSKQQEPENPQEKLKEFIDPDRSPQAQEALKQLFKQIALVQVGKALLLHSWGSESFSRNELKNLTSSIEKGMRPFLNLQTSSSQLIQRNFYSWYNLSEDHQEELWSLIQNVKVQDPNLEKTRDWIFSKARKLSAETLGERDRYSKVFYQILWKSIQSHQMIKVLNRSVFGFSPTLRDGSVMEHSPENIEWIGFEPLSFELLFCEIRYLWKKPRSLPLWIKGSSLEMSMEPQESLLLTHSGKQNTLHQIEGISSCEIAIIAEENPIQTQSRTLAGQALRKQIEEHTILRKIKQPQCTRGIYQACQSLEKLRQGGTLVWAREEILNETSGKPALQYILNQAKIIFIADLSAIECSENGLKNNLPKSLYVLQKENHLETRKGHRPLMIKAYGSVHSIQDIHLLFDRIFSLTKNPSQSFPHEPFQIHSRISPIEQREWEHHWFNPADDQIVDQIESLKRNSTALGELAILRTTSWPELQKTLESEVNVDPTFKIPNRFFVWTESGENGNEIQTSETLSGFPVGSKKGPVFIVYPQDARYLVPLQTLIRSQMIREWLDYSTERKKGKWILNEADIKSVPIPRHIELQLRSLTEAIPESPVSGFEQRVLSLVSHRPNEALALLENHKTEAALIKGSIFVSASQALHRLNQDYAQLFSMIDSSGQPIPDLIEKNVLQKNDWSRIDQHSLIRFSSTLGEHQAILNVTKVTHPSPGLLFATAKGLTQFVQIEDPWLRERLFEKLMNFQKIIPEPSWKEICEEILLPKNPEQVRIAGIQILHAYQREKLRKKELIHLLGACLKETGNPTSAPKIGMLQ